jgi:hypothetical protein
MEQLGLFSALLSVVSRISSGQLIRFVRSVLGSRVASELERESSESGRVERLVSELIRAEKVDDALFDRLEAMSPQAHELIEHARTEWRTQQAASAPANLAIARPGAAPDESAEGEWRRRIKQRVSSVTHAQREPPPWLLGALSVLPSFDPVALSRNAIMRERLDVSGLLTDLAAVADPRPDGRWALKLDKRRAAISTIVENDLRHAVEMAETLAVGKEAEPYLAILRQYMEDGTVRVRPSSAQPQLLAARELGEWFVDSPYQPVDADRVATILAAREQIEPLQRLVGSHFRGRIDELALLGDTDGFGPENQKVLVLTGVGGVGKSALLGKHILDLLDQTPPPPVVYVDFDRSDAEAADPKRMIEVIARSLSLIYAGSEQELIFVALESASAGDTDAARFEVVLPTHADPETLLHALAEQVKQLPRSDETLFIFDTFEQVMRRGSAVVERFEDFLRELLAALPFARAILSGRGQIKIHMPRHDRHLGDLDAESADAVLEARKISDPDVRRKLIQTIGTSPLMLRIGSAAVLKGQLNTDKLDLLAAGAARLRLQGLLYSRVLGHLGDPEVERLAHPGLVVRRLTPGVIRSVLADICQIEPAAADSLFKRLPDFVELFEPDESSPGEERALRHRQDLREDVLDVMINDPAWAPQIEKIHRNAVEFYRDRRDAVGRAEALYHSLMLNEPPERLDALWTASLATSLSRSWSDPIPPRARQWLAYRLGLDTPVMQGDLRLLDWEERAARSARSSLDARKPQRALDDLRERVERTPQSPVTLIEMEALDVLGRGDEALEVAREALARIPPDAPPGHRRDVLLSAAEIALKVDKSSVARELADQAAELAQAFGDERSRIRALEICARAQHDDFARELERVFVSANTTVLRGDANTVARVVESIGRESPDVLLKAAETFAYDPERSILKSDPAVWRDLFQTVAEHTDGDKLLMNFARRAGLASTQSDPLQIATGMVKHGLQGEALAAVLGTFGDDRKIREQSAATFQGSSHVF